MGKPIENNNSVTQVSQRKAEFSLIKDKGLFFIAALLIVVVVLSWGALNRIEKQVRLDIQQTLQKVLETTDETIKNWTDDRIDDSLLILDRPDVQQLIQELLALPRDREVLANSRSLRQLRLIIKPLLDKHADQGMSVYAPDGITIASMRDINLGQVNFFPHHQNSFKNMLNGEPQLIPPLRPAVVLPGVAGKPAHSEPVMFIGVPVTDQDGKVIAVFTIHINPSIDFTRIVQIARTGLSGDSYVFDKNGYLVSESRFDDQLRIIGLLKEDERSILNLKLLDSGGNLLEGFQPLVPRENLALTLMAQKATAGASGFNLDGYRDYRGVPVVGAWGWHEQYNFGQAFEIDVAEAYKSFFAIRRTVIALLLITVLLFLGLAVGLIRRKRQAEMMNIQLAQEVVERQKGEDRFRALLESSPSGMIVSNKAGDIILVNRQVEKIFGYPDEELLGRKIELLIPQSFAVKHQKHRDVFFENPNIRPMGVDFDLWGIRKDGSEFPVGITLSPVETGGEIATIASIIDTTKRKQAEERLHRDSERTKLLLEFYTQAPELTNKELYDYVLDKAVSLTASTIGFFHLVAEDQQNIILTTWNGEALKNCTVAYDVHYPLEEAGNWVDCIRQSRPVIYNDFPSSPNRKGLPDGHAHLQRFMSIPVMKGEKICYVFGVGNKEEEYSQHDVVQIQLIANELSKIIGQRQAEKALMESKQKFQRLVENLEDKYFFYSRGIDGVFTYVSPSLFNILGYTVDEYLKHYSQTLTNNPINQKVEQFTAASLQGDRQPSYLVEVYHQDGSKRWLEVSESPVLDDNGRITAIEGVANDVTVRIEAEEELIKHREHLEELVRERTTELQESEEIFRSITSLAQAGIIMINSAGDVTFWNKAAEKMFGWSASEAEGMPLHHMIVPEEFQTAHLAGLKKFHKTGQGSLLGQMVAVTAVRRDKSKLPLELSLSAVNLKGVWHAIGILSDITNRKETEAELLKNIDELQRFSKMAMGREKEMVRLKEEINSLLIQLGKESKYKIVQ